MVTRLINKVWKGSRFVAFPISYSFKCQIVSVDRKLDAGYSQTSEMDLGMREHEQRRLMREDPPEANGRA